MGYILIAVFLTMFFLKLPSKNIQITGAAVAERYRITHYYTASEDDFPVWTTTQNPSLGGAAACKIPQSERGFYEEVKCQGSGITKTKLVCQYDKITPDKESAIKTCLNPACLLYTSPSPRDS